MRRLFLSTWSGPTLAPRRLRALVPSALSHGLAVSAVLAAALSFAACDRSPTAAGASKGDEQKQIASLVAAYTPISAIATSDKQDKWFHDQVQVLEQMRKGSPKLGEAALARFNAGTDKLPDLRAALLDVAAHCAPEATAPQLEQMIRTYDGEGGLALRTRAVEYLAETSPQRAIAMYEPMLRDPLPHQTRPSQEQLVIAWSTAAHKLGLTDARVLCDVATDLKQPPEARYAALKSVAEFGGPRAIKALEEVLVEANSDGLMRRLAAQSLQALLKPEDLCPLLRKMSEFESDPNFIDFLADMLARNNCP
jgi:hypothetical protein